MVCVVVMTGRIGTDPELKTVGSEKLLTFRFANDTGFGTRKTTSWYDVNYWGKGGEVAYEYLKKGSQIALSGEQKIVEFDRKDGTKGTKVEIRVSQLDFPQREAGSSAGRAVGPRAGAGQAEASLPLPTTSKTRSRSSTGQA